MNNKKWVLGFIAGLIGIMIGIAAFNYCVDPYHYFHSTYGEGYYYASPQVTLNDRVRQYEYLKNNHEKYQGVIIGGSKAQGVDAEYLSNIAGIKYYNMGVTRGNFLDYYNYINWIAEHTEIKHVLLYLSTLEVGWYTEEERKAEEEGSETPAAIDTSKSKVKEFVSYLYKGGVKASWYYLSDMLNGNLVRFEITRYGTRNDAENLNRRRQDAEDYIDTVVNNSLNSAVIRLLYGDAVNMPAIQRNIDALRAIKDICDKSEIELDVVIGNTYVVQAASYEGEEYYDYLRKMAQVTDFWDFGFLNKYNMNPYNFYDNNHMLVSVSEKMIDTMYGIGQLENFGIYVTKDNVEEYIEQRKNVLISLKEEYERYGELALGTYFDKSYIASDLLYPTQSNTGSTQQKTVILNDCQCVEQHYTAKKNKLEGIGIYLICEEDAKGYIRTELYDVSNGDLIEVKEIDVEKVANYFETLICFDLAETMEGRQYCIRISFTDLSEKNAAVKLILCSGDSIPSAYTKVESISESYQVKMSLYEEMTETEYLIWSGNDKLVYDNTIGGESFAFSGLYAGDSYEQKFISNSETLLYLEFYPVTWNYHYSEDSKLFFEIYDAANTLIAEKEVAANILSVPTYRIVFDKVVPMVEGEQYTIKISSNIKSEENPLEVFLIATNEIPITRNGKLCNGSLKFRIYSLEK